jgi:hypothetical protein
MHVKLDRAVLSQRSLCHILHLCRRHAISLSLYVYIN